eukprot:363250-Chlamydomonas_euryale.AAC.11
MGLPLALCHRACPSPSATGPAPRPLPPGLPLAPCHRACPSPPATGPAPCPLPMGLPLALCHRACPSPSPPQGLPHCTTGPATRHSIAHSACLGHEEFQHFESPCPRAC